MSAIGSALSAHAAFLKICWETGEITKLSVENLFNSSGEIQHFTVEFICNSGEIRHLTTCSLLALWPHCRRAGRH